MVRACNVNTGGKQISTITHTSLGHHTTQRVGQTCPLPAYPHYNHQSVEFLLKFLVYRILSPFIGQSHSCQLCGWCSSCSPNASPSSGGRCFYYADNECLHVDLASPCASFGSTGKLRRSLRVVPQGSVLLLRRCKKIWEEA